MDAATRTRTTAESVKVRIPLARVQEWKTLFTNGSTAQIVYSAESDVFVIASVPGATSVPPQTTLSDIDSSPTPESSSAPAFTTLLLVTAAIVAVVAALFIVVRKRVRKHGIPSLLSSMLASGGQTSAASPSMLEDGWSEWSSSSHNALSVCESPRHETTATIVPHVNRLVSAQEAPKRVPLIIYEGEQ